MLRLDDAPGQWVFDRSAALGSGAAGGARSLLAVVISAGGPHDALDHADARGEGRGAAAPARPGPSGDHLGRTSSPNAARPTPARRGWRARRADASRRGVYLAGDYTDPVFPATLEAATRSGVAAARALIADGAAGAAARGSTRAP